MTAFAMRRNEIRMAADFLARAEAWVEQAAPEVQADIERIRAGLLLRADGLMEADNNSTPLPTVGQRLRDNARSQPRWRTTGPEHRRPAAFSR